MLSRILWITAAGIALVAGTILQNGDSIFGSSHRSIDASIDRAVDRSVDRTVDRTIHRTIDRAVDRGVDHMQVVGSDGQEIDVSPETKRALAAAVGRLVAAESDHALLRIRHASDEQLEAADARRIQARAEVDRLKAQVKGQEQAARLEHEAVRDSIRRQIRDDIRDAVRD
jgi:hypothetical protein